MALVPAALPQVAIQRSNMSLVRPSHHLSEHSELGKIKSFGNHVVVMIKEVLVQ